MSIYRYYIQIFSAITFSLVLFSCKSGDTVPKPVPSSLKVEDIKAGTGTEAKFGKKVTVHYIGTLTDGTKFDSSRDKNKTFTFELGDGIVIEGWDLGLQGMKVGGIRKLTIPSDLGYGSEGSKKIPANSTLIFEIELLNVE